MAETTQEIQSPLNAYLAIQGQPLGWLAAATQWLAPREAEGAVVAKDQRAADLLDAIQQGRVMPPEAREQNPLMTGRFDAFKRQVYQAVLDAAQRRPETATVQYAPEGLPGGAVGQYTPSTHAIALNMRPIRTQAGTYATAPPTSIAAQNTVSHELLHFLLNRIPPELVQQGAPAFPDIATLPWYQRMFTASPGKADVAAMTGSEPAEHRIIKYLLGNDRAPGSLEEYANSTPLSGNLNGSTAMEALYKAFLRQIFLQPDLLNRALAGVGR